MRGERVDLSVISMVDQFVPVSWAFVVFMEGKIKIADMDTIGMKFIDLLKTQGEHLFGSKMTHNFHKGKKKKKKKKKKCKKNKRNLFIYCDKTIQFFITAFASLLPSEITGSLAVQEEGFDVNAEGYVNSKMFLMI